MLVNKEFTFSLNVSVGCYPTKKPKMFYLLQYQTESGITIQDVIELEKKGKSFCYLFKEVNEGGLVTQEQKTISGFASTSVIFFDIDKMPISMTDYIKPLPYKPSFAYTSYSNGTEHEYWKYGYRLAYVFDKPVTTVQDFDTLYYSIAAANGFTPRKHPDGTPYEFDYRIVNQQYYGGGIRSESYATDIIYSQDDFSSFKDKGLELQRVIQVSKPKQKQSKPKGTKKTSFPNENNIAKRGNAYSSQMENPFYSDFYSLPPKEFIDKYQRDYIGAYHASLTTPLLDSGDIRYAYLPEDYQEIKRHWGINAEGKRCVRKWEVGSGRKKRLYVSAQIMKHNLPDITKEELMYNLAFERYHYYDNSDGNLNNKILETIAENALNYTFSLSPRKHKSFTVNKEYCASVGLTCNQVKNTIRKEIKESQVLALYDFGMSVKENLQVMKDNGIKVGKSYLYELRKRYSEEIPRENNIAKRGEAYSSQMEKQSV